MLELTGDRSLCIIPLFYYCMATDGAWWGIDGWAPDPHPPIDRQSVWSWPTSVPVWGHVWGHMHSPSPCKESCTVYSYCSYSTLYWYTKSWIRRTVSSKVFNFLLNFLLNFHVWHGSNATHVNSHWTQYHDFYRSIFTYHSKTRLFLCKFNTSCHKLLT